MDTADLLKLIKNGEDTKHQFKSDVIRADSLATEMVALSNSQGGLILIGVADNGGISGLTPDDMRRINQLVSNASVEHVRPPISPATENFILPNGMVMVVEVPEGVSKPYMDRNLHVYVKVGADKRKVNAREELLRIFQQAALVHADAIPVKSSSVSDIDKAYFDAYFEKEFGELPEYQEMPVARLLESMNLAKDGQLNIGGILLFGLRPQYKLPVFHVKAVAFPGIAIEDVHYIDSQDIKGKLADVFRATVGFALSNIKHVQNGQSVNSLGEPEIPRVVFQELVANALIHRDYFVSAPVKLLVFADRVEIVSPGRLPNNLTVENIKLGNSNIRNPILASFAPRLLPYRGLGSGIRRALKAYSDIELLDDQDGNAFRATIRRLSPR